MSMRMIVVALSVAAASGPADAQKRNLNFDLLAAARASDIASVSRLLDEGATPNARNRLGDTPLNMAARQGQSDLVRLLLARGADVNQPNLARVTPLMSAAFGGHEEVVRQLLAQRADRRQRTGSTRLRWSMRRATAASVASGRCSTLAATPTSATPKARRC